MGQFMDSELSNSFVNKQSVMDNSCLPCRIKWHQHGFIVHQSYVSKIWRKHWQSWVWCFVSYAVSFAAFPKTDFLYIQWLAANPLIPSHPKTFSPGVLGFWDLFPLLAPDVSTCSRLWFERVFWMVKDMVVDDFEDIVDGWDSGVRVWPKIVKTIISAYIRGVLPLYSSGQEVYCLGGS